LFNKGTPFDKIIRAVIFVQRFELVDFVANNGQDRQLQNCK